MEFTPSMGNKKKEKKAAKKRRDQDKSLQRYLLVQCSTKGCKSKCCKKYKKCEAKRCKRCPCVDLLKKRPEFNRKLESVA